MDYEQTVERMGQIAAEMRGGRDLRDGKAEMSALYHELFRTNPQLKDYRDAPEAYALISKASSVVRAAESSATWHARMLVGEGQRIHPGGRDYAARLDDIRDRIVAMPYLDAFDLAACLAELAETKAAGLAGRRLLPPASRPDAGGSALTQADAPEKDRAERAAADAAQAALRDEVEREREQTAEAGARSDRLDEQVRESEERIDKRKRKLREVDDQLSGGIFGTGADGREAETLREKSRQLEKDISRDEEELAALTRRRDDARTRVQAAWRRDDARDARDKAASQRTKAAGTKPKRHWWDF